VAFPFPTTEVAEGAARILVPAIHRPKGPGRKGPWPFYNPTMSLNRDLSAMVLHRWPGRLHEVLDGLAATGIWGIRMLLEARVERVTFNDSHEEACDLIRENVARNGLHADVMRGAFVDAVRGRTFDFVDIDPFGSPRPSLEDAIRYGSRGMGIGVTATDTAALSGTYPDTCVRRYAARPFRCPQGHEIGLRILLGYAARFASARDRTVRPLMAFAAEHFFRMYLTIDDGPPLSAPIGYVVRDPGGRFVPTEPYGEAIGPLWLGSLGDADFVRRLGPSDWTRPASARLLARLQEEADMPVFFVTTDELAMHLQRSPPSLRRYLDALHESGFRATRTHFDPKGVKADAPHDEVVRIFRSVAPSGPTDG
jgi:tRNA (guanine26-N2/guanine27-N2)-dimethyltransferase